MMELHLLGPAEVNGEDGRELEPLSAQPKRFALLAYLALPRPGTFHRRDNLLALFWPDMDQARARSALRKILYYLRRALRSDVVITRGTEEIGLDSRKVWCDVATFEASIQRDDLETALRLYRGDLLAGFFLSNGSGFEEWLEAERGRLRDQAVVAAWKLAEWNTQGKREVATQYARRAVSLAPYDETGIQRLIKLLDRLGDRGGALREYRDYARRLREEFDSEPSPETQALISAVRARDENSVSVVTEAHMETAGNPEGLSDGPTWNVRRRLGEVSSRARWRVTAFVTAVALALVGIIVFTLLDVSERDREHVLVAVFENRTGDTTLDVLGQTIAHWISRGLAWPGIVSVASPLKTMHVTPTLDGMDPDDYSPTAVEAMAGETNAAIAVWGAYYGDGSAIRFEANLSDMTRSRLVRRLDPVRASLDSARQAMIIVREQVLNAVAEELDQRLVLSATSDDTPPSLPAYSEFVRGIEAFYVHREAGRASRRLSRAVELAPDFAPAIIMAALIEAKSQRYRRADSVLAQLEGNLSLSILDQLHWEWLGAWTQGDWATAYYALTRLLQLRPDDDFLAAEYVRTAARFGRYREALGMLDRMEPEGAWLSYWHWLQRALHFLGQYERELAVARQARGSGEPDLLPSIYEVRARAAMGQVSELRRVLDDAMRRASSPPLHPYVYAHAGMELMTHGFEDEGRPFLEESAAMFERIRPKVAATRGLGRADLMDPAAILYALGRLDEAQELYEQLLEWGVDEPVRGRNVALETRIHARGRLGMIAAKRGLRSEALRYAEEIEEASPPYMHGFDLIHRAGIMAQLGERYEAINLFNDALASGFEQYRVHDFILDDFTPLRGERALEVVFAAGEQ